MDIDVLTDWIWPSGIYRSLAIPLRRSKVFGYKMLLVQPLSTRLMVWNHTPLYNNDFPHWWHTPFTDINFGIHKKPRIEANIINPKHGKKYTNGAILAG
jgi:hypothetical protein